MRYPRLVATLSLRDDDARLVYLATVYHLGRPGSEIDATAPAEHGPGLAAVRDALEPQLERAEATLELSGYQLSRVGRALHGVVNELKQYEMAGGRSAVPAFAETVARLFPETLSGGGAALDLAQRAVMLRRRLDAAVREADAALASASEAAAVRADPVAVDKPRRWWQGWRRRRQR